MAGSEAAKSALEKPLSELTEEDIAQVTREDCRKFLKQKGELILLFSDFISFSLFELYGISIWKVDCLGF